MTYTESSWVPVTTTGFVSATILLVERETCVRSAAAKAIGWLRIMCAGYRPVTDDLAPAPDRQPRVRVPRTRTPENA